MEVFDITQKSAEDLTDKGLEMINDELNKKSDVIQNNWDYDRPWDEYEEAFEDINRVSSVISCERRFRMKPEMSKHDGGDLMTFKEFKECCNDGGFIDYDGYGYYSNETHKSNITIYPSDITDGKIRTDFTHVCWYNR